MVKKFNQINFLKKKSLNLRKKFIQLLLEGYKYHIGGTLSCLDIMVVLFYNKNINPLEKKNFFILSKGHALASLFLILFDKKKLKQKKFNELNKLNKLGNQLDIYNLKNIDWSTGSLGHSVGVGIGLAISNPNKKIWIILGDGEIDEGSIWEAIFYIAEKKIKNIYIIIDKNNISASKVINNPIWYKKKLLQKLDFRYFEANGHSHEELNNILQKIFKNKKSALMIANTIKGKGIKYFENKIKYNHNLPEKSLLFKSLKFLESNK
tara:strand:- start:34813 stop:35607 length:795 start_codon:yes stop_codon:yes gene_type:complete